MVGRVGESVDSVDISSKCEKVEKLLVSHVLRLRFRSKSRLSEGPEPAVLEVGLFKVHKKLVPSGNH